MARKNDRASLLRPCIWCVLFGLAVARTFADDGGVHRAAIDVDGVQRVMLVGGSYFFRPASIIVKADIPVELTVHMDGGLVPHNIVIEAPDGRRVVNESLGTTTKVIRFVPPTPGNYPFYCDNRLLFFKSHRARGMAGVLEVE